MKKLNELIEENDNLDTKLSIEEIYPYRKSLYTYYKDYYGCEPVFMVTFLTNSIAAGKIVPETELNEAIEFEVNNGFPMDENDEDQFAEWEQIGANSKLLKDLL